MLPPGWPALRVGCRLGNVRALLLDLDDTLLDYSGDVDLSWSQACHAGCTGTVRAEQLLPAIAEARRWFWSDPERHRRERVNMLRAWQQIVVNALERLGASDDGLAAAIALDFAARRRERMRLYPETLDCLAMLRERGVPLGLVTNGDASQQRDKIERHALGRFFDVIVIEGEFGVGKPHEAVFRHALGVLGARPDETWMAGDHLEFDVGGAQRLGMRAAWMDRTDTGLPAGCSVRPDRIIRTLKELM
jgi:putative hydrolase of the HAD superfamily